MKIRQLLHIIKYFILSIFDLLGYIILFILRLLFLLPKRKHFDSKRIKKILIIRLDRIGDVVLSTPTFSAVRKKYPKAEITLLIASYTKSLVLNNKSFDRLLVLGESSYLEILKMVRKLNIDLAVILSSTFRNNFIAFASGADYRIGYDRPCGSFFLTKKVPIDLKLNTFHRVDLYLSLLQAIGIHPEDKEIVVSITEDGEKIADEYFEKNTIDLNRPIVAVHPGSRQKYIRWKEKGFAEVADKLIETYNAQVILIGSNNERDLVDSISLSMKNTPFVAVGLPLTGLVSLLKRCSLFIGNSTGPMHIAAALKVPVVAIFGSIHPLDHYQKWGPWGEGHIVVSKDLGCKNCYPADCKTFDCLRLITVMDVLEAVGKQFKTINLNSKSR